MQGRTLPLLPHASSKQWHLASKGSQTSSAYTIGCGHTRLQPFQSVSSRQSQSFPWVWAMKPDTQHCDPSCTSDPVSQVGKCRAEAMTVLCRFLSILAATNWLLSSLLWLQSGPSVKADLPSRKETFQREREHFLFHSSLGSVSPILISLFFSFFCPT